MLKLKGEVVDLGHMPDEEGGTEVFVLRLAAGRLVTIKGLSRDECVAIKPLFCAQCVIEIRAPEDVQG